MVALWILGILLALILLVLFLRVGVRIAFGDELRVTAAAGPVRIQIVPSPPEKAQKTEKAQGEVLMSFSAITQSTLAIRN